MYLNDQTADNKPRIFYMKPVKDYTTADEPECPKCHSKHIFNNGEITFCMMCGHVL